MVLIQDVFQPGEEPGLRGIGGGGLDGLAGRTGLATPEGDPLLFPVLWTLGEEFCPTQSTAGELSRLCLFKETKVNKRRPPGCDGVRKPAHKYLTE